MDTADDRELPPRRWTAEEPLLDDGHATNRTALAATTPPPSGSQGKALSPVWAPRMVS